MATTSENSSGESKKNGFGDSGGEGNEQATYECNICLDTAKDAVVSMCGHLFCWPCLHQWLETRPTKQMCPVCKAGISRDKVIPIYGRGGSNTDPREKLPPRPPGQRTEPENIPRNPFSPFGFEGQASFSFGIGAFPFGLFASFFTMGHPGGDAAREQHTEQDEFVSRMFLWVALVFIVWLIMA